MRRRLTEEAVRRIAPVPGKQIDVFDQGMPGLILRVSYGGTKSWRALYYVNHRAKTHPLGRYPIIDLKSARDAARKFLSNPQSVLARANSGTVREVAEDFIRRHVVANKLRSKLEIERCLRAYIYPAWEGRKFAEIRRGDVTVLLDRIEDQNGPRQADVVLALIRKMSNWYAARNDDYVTPVVKGMARTKPAERRRDRILSDDEIRLLTQLYRDLGTFGSITIVLLLTGQRLRKVALMRWGDIDQGIWTISTAHREKANAGKLPLPSVVRELLDRQPRIDGVDYIFPAARGNGPFNSFGKGKSLLDERLKEALPDLRPWVLHDLRRTARSLMSRAGVLPHIAERTLGHAIAGVEAIYDRHTYDAEKTEALQKLASLVMSIAGPNYSNVVTIDVPKRSAAA